MLSDRVKQLAGEDHQSFALLLGEVPFLKEAILKEDADIGIRMQQLDPNSEDFIAAYKGLQTQRLLLQDFLTIFNVVPSESKVELIHSI